MIEIHIQLYSILREKLPPDMGGKTVLQLEDGATLRNVLDNLGIDRKVVISINGEHEPDKARRLRNDDEIKIFSAVSGG